MLNDLRFALRTLRQHPGFALTAIFSIALGIGAASTIFSLVDGLLLRPLAVLNASQLVTLRSVAPTVSGSQFAGASGAMSYPDFADFRDRNRSFDGLLAYQLSAFGFARDAQSQPQMKMGFLVSGNFFRVLGVSPQLGRGFNPEEDQVPARDAVIVLSHDLWAHEFGADASVIGSHVNLSGTDFTIVGVAPESFKGLDQFIRPAFFVPIMMGAKLPSAANENLLTGRDKRTFMVKGRLKSGVSIEAANQEAAGIAKSLEQSYPGTNRAIGAGVVTEIQARLALLPFYAGVAASLFFLAGIVLLIACSNVANLTLGRSRSRAREIAVRLAIGAGRLRLVQQLMTESLVIALAGGALGLLMADTAAEVFSRLEIVGETPIQLNFQLDHRVLYFTLFVSVASAIVFGLVPAIQSARTDLTPALKSGEPEYGRKRFFGRRALVTAQIAGSVVLLAAATAQYRSSVKMLFADHGFRRDHLLTMKFDPSLIGYTPAQTAQFYKTLIDRTRQAPAVKSAALALFIPLTSTIRQQAVIPEGYAFPSGQESTTVLESTVDEHYFETLDVHILEGRGFLPADLANSPRVAVVNQAFARKYLGPKPIGKRIRLNDANGPWLEVVGVAVTGKYLAVSEPPTEFLYLPLSQDPQPRMTLFAESYGDPAALAGPLRQLVHSIDSNLPIFSVRTMDDIFEQTSVKTRDLTNGILISAGLIGLSLAVVGLFAVVAYQVARRTREIGVRVALGAGRSQIAGMVLRSAATMSVTGIGIGLALSFAAARARGAQPLQPFDRLVTIVVPVSLLLTALLAAALPAWRASRIDPQRALRQD